MSIIVKPYTAFPGDVIRSSNYNQNFDTIYNDYNGNITNANIAPAAGIHYGKLVTMSGDATITDSGVITVNSSNFLKIQPATSIQDNTVYNLGTTNDGAPVVLNTYTVNITVPGTFLVTITFNYRVVLNEAVQCDSETVFDLNNSTDAVIISTKAANFGFIDTVSNSIGGAQNDIISLTNLYNFTTLGNNSIQFRKQNTQSLAVQSRTIPNLGGFNGGPINFYAVRVAN